MKKFKIFSAIAVFFMAIALVSCGPKEPPTPDPVKVTGVTLNKETVNLEVNGTEQLSYTITPSNADDKSVSWSTSASSVATVNNGLVTAVAPGNATITITTTDGSYTDTCNVTVATPIPAVVHVTGITLNKTTATLEIGETEQLTAVVAPENADNKNVTWESSSTGVATVANGLVTAKAAGTTTITAKTEDGNKTATCTVTVNEPAPVVINVTGVTLNKETTTLVVGGTEQLTAVVAPENATNKTVTWTSDTTSVATVNDGLVTAVSAGTAVITAKTEDGNKTATCTVTVRNPEPEQVAGTIQLDGNCNPTYSLDSYTLTYGGYDFKLQNTSENTNGYITLSKGGYLLNTTAFGDIDSFKVVYTVDTLKTGEVQSDVGFGSLYYTTDTHTITAPASYTRVEAPNNELVTLENNPNFIAFYTFNRINITSITINYDTNATYTETYSDFDLKLFLTNDIHGQVNADSSHAGLVNASGYIEAYKGDYNLLLDQGDIYQGSLACYLTGGHVMDDYLLMNGYESTILGNHEWDWSETNIVGHRDYSPYVKLLACNVRYKDGTTPDWVRNYYITERAGVKIGVIGCLGDISGSISEDMITNIKFLVDDRENRDFTLTNMIKGYAEELREQGCQYVILQIHQGSDGYSGKTTDIKDCEYKEIDYSKLEGKLDLVCESHSHKSYFHKDNYGIYHVQCGGYLSCVGNVVIHVSFDGNTPTFTIDNDKVYLTNASSLKGKTSAFFNTVNEWYAENVYREQADRIVATVPSNLSGTQVNQLAADSLWDMLNVYSSDLSGYTVSVAGGFIKCRSPGKLDAGNATMSDIANLFPFDNELYLVKIDGKDLKYYFLKNNTNYYFAGNMDSSTQTTFSATYYILTDSYTYFGLGNGRELYGYADIVINFTQKYGIYTRDVLANYLGKIYEAKPQVEISLTPSNFNYSTSPFTMKIDNDANLTVTHSNVEFNSQYNEYNIKKNGGQITITVPEGYKIVKIDVDQNNSYTNLKFYNTAECTSELSYTPVGGTHSLYSIDINSNTLVIKNSSTYNVNFYSMTIVVEKIAQA